MASNIEFRSVGELSTDDGRTVYGIAVPYDTDTEISDGYAGYTERFERGAFARSIEQRGHKVQLYTQHDTGKLPIGKAVKLEERSEGLYAEFRVSETAAGNDALALVRDGVVSAFSIGFKPLKNRESRTGNKRTVVRIEAALIEVSLVGMPAYETAAVQGVRSESSEESFEMSENIVEPTTAENTVGRSYIRTIEPQAVEVETPDTYAGRLSLVADEAQARSLFEAVTRREAARVETRATVTSATSSAGNVGGYAMPIPFAPRRIVDSGNVPAEVIAGPAAHLAFPVFGSTDTAGVTAEGAAKPEYDDITAGTVTPQTIAVWSGISNQTLLTASAFQQSLLNKHAQLIAKTEDAQVVSAITGNTGTQSLIGALSADQILVAAAMVADRGANANLVLVNPADIEVILGTGVGTGGDASPEFRTWSPRLYGMNVYASSAVAAGGAVVGAFNVGARLVVGQRPTVLVDPYSQVTSNVTRIVSEEAVGLALVQPDLFVELSAV